MQDLTYCFLQLQIFLPCRVVCKCSQKPKQYYALPQEFLIAVWYTIFFWNIKLNVFFLFLDKFIGATVQSGCSGAPWAIQKAPKKHALSLADKLDCPTTPSTALVDCIRKVSADQIMEVKRKL